MYLIKTTKENRKAIKAEIEWYGEVDEDWPDGIFNFEPSNEVSEDELVEKLDELKVEYEFV